MSFLLDTNVLSELRKASRAHPRVLAWAGDQDADRYFISVITLLEVERGVLRIERRDPAGGRTYRRWFNDEVLGVFADRTIPIDRPVARFAAQLHVPDPAPENDTLLAATAIFHGLTVITRNTKDFERAGVPVVNPWEFTG